MQLKLKSSIQFLFSESIFEYQVTYVGGGTSRLALIKSQLLLELPKAFLILCSWLKHFASFGCIPIRTKIFDFGLLSCHVPSTPKFHFTIEIYPFSLEASSKMLPLHLRYRPHSYKSGSFQKTLSLNKEGKIWSSTTDSEDRINRTEENWIYSESSFLITF